MKREPLVANVGLMVASSSGSAIWVSLNIAIMQEQPGAPKYFIVIMKDIAERNQVEINLRGSERFAQATMDALSTHICVVDANGVILAVNQAWCTFNRSNGARHDRIAEGMNYLQICDFATGDAAHTAGLVARGIREVLTGKRTEYELEYPCEGQNEQRWFLLKVTRFPENGPMRAVITHLDITERERASVRLLHMAYHDELTSLPNRILFEDRLNQAIHHAKRNNCLIAVLFLDVDHFKLVNDTLGHAAGDKLLQEAGRRLSTCLRGADTIGRLGGDEFAIILTDLVLHYQPQLALDSGQIIGVEALVRWQHLTLGTVPPADFIPVAEENGLIVPIGEWVMRTACEQSKRWQDAGLPPVQVAVNMAARQLMKKDVVDIVRSTLHETGLDPRYYLELELTESMMMDKSEHIITILDSLKALGVQISIDDFGTGYSNLGYLEPFPLDTLKIDKSFVQRIGCDLQRHSDGGAIAKTIIQLAHSLGYQVIAEGVETEAQLRYLQHHGCDYIQGHYYSRPIHPEALALLLMRASSSSRGGPGLPPFANAAIVSEDSS
jgi:diguanylate cyclase (GGDEF)-like protein